VSIAKKPRDPRLDFFRGLSLLAIFFAHIPGGWAREFIWARFGLSDAAHVFVFISGFAAAIAFGGTFVKKGFVTGTARIAWRVAQLYACHLALFFLALFLTAAFDLDYADYLGIDGFFADPISSLVALFTLRYVPTYFDILPLYMLVLASVPLVMALARLHPGLVIAGSVALWSLVQATGFNLPAGEGRSWGFNPLAWQLIFLAGFAFSRGWIVPPKPTRPLLGLCFAYLAFGAAAEIPWLWTLHPDLEALHDWAYAHAHKPNLDLRQFAHFLALAFVALWFVRDRLHWLASPLGKPLVRLGQQALPVFFSGMALSHLGGIAMAAYGTAFDVQLVVHGLGIAGLFAVAAVARYVKNAPWKTGAQPPKAAPQPVPAAVSAPSVAR
jgi:hypothetical protein